MRTARASDRAPRGVRISRAGSPLRLPLPDCSSTEWGSADAFGPLKSVAGVSALSWKIARCVPLPICYPRRSPVRSARRRTKKKELLAPRVKALADRLCGPFADVLADKERLNMQPGLVGCQVGTLPEPPMKSLASGDDVPRLANSNGVRATKWERDIWANEQAEPVGSPDREH